MALEREQIEALVPDSYPPDALVPGLRRAYFGRRLDLDDVLSRSYFWVAALQTEFERSGLWLAIPGYNYATYGFLKVDYDEYVFGVRVNTYPWPAPTQGGIFAYLSIADARFPVIVHRQERPDRLHYDRPPRYRYRYPKEHPRAGTTTCLVHNATEFGDSSYGRYARSLGAHLDNDEWEGIGLLTAGHIVAGCAIGDKVDLTTGQLYSKTGEGYVVRIGPPRVDAAIIGPSSQEWTPGRRIRVREFVAPGTPSRLLGQHSGVTQSIVREVSNPRFSVSRNYNNVEFLVFLEDAARDGDSGALVTADDGSNEGLGLYLGEADDINGKDVLGRCQLLAQVRLALRVTLYHWL